MNGQDPNLNNGLNSETLGSTTLGMAQNNVNVNINPTQVPNNAVNNIPNPTQVPNTTPNNSIPVTPIENLETLTPASSQINEPIARPIPGTEGTLTSNTVGINNNFTPNNNVNDFTNSNKVENIGMVPPQNETPKKKKGISKILFVLLIIVLIGAVAFGVYYFLNISNNIVKLTPKEVNIGLGETIPDNINDYATITKGDASSCNVNTRNVDSSVIGEYEVTILCGKNTFKTKVIVGDKTAPVAVLNTVFKTINSTAVVEDFIKSCSDLSNCKTSIVDEAKLKEYLSVAGGPYEVAIEAVDDIGNAATYNAILYVTENPISLYANFSSTETNLTDYKAKKVINDILPLSATLEFQKVARRDYKYTFENESVYNEVVKEKPTTITFDGITGIARYNDKNLTLEISTDLSYETLKNENNGDFPTSYQEIQAIYKDTKGYTPSFIKNYPAAENEE